MKDYMIHPTFLFISLGVLILLSAFFALAETALLSVNRYRLRHLVRQNNLSAKQVQQLLERPDRMLGVILLCDTFSDILASAIATLLALHYFGEAGILGVTLVLTFVVLIFGEMTPKTLATVYPQKLAFFSAWPLIILLRLLYPLVWLTNGIANALLRIVGVKPKSASIEHLSHEEFRTVVHEAGGRLPADYQSMLLKVLELEDATVEDIMIPRNEIKGIDISDDWDLILEQLTKSQHNRLLIYRETIDQVLGFLHVRVALNYLAEQKLNKETFLASLEETYFVPEGTALNIQLLNFRREKKRIGLVVDEYGDLQGLITLEDILEEIVGQFTTDMAAIRNRTVIPQADGSCLVDGSMSVRELNRALHCQLPVEGPKTLNGLITEYLETIPQAGVALKIAGQPMEIMEVKGNSVKTVKILK
jgi:Mg2+/Co2+ transporter CorB